MKEDNKIIYNKNDKIDNSESDTDSDSEFPLKHQKTLKEFKNQFSIYLPTDNVLNKRDYVLNIYY